MFIGVFPSSVQVDKYTGVAAAATVGAFLQESGPTVETMLEYLDEHYDDGIVLQPMLAQLLTALHRGGWRWWRASAHTLVHVCRSATCVRTTIRADNYTRVSIRSVVGQPTSMHASANISACRLQSRDSRR
jgi:hypothetical protein